MADESVLNRWGGHIAPYVILLQALTERRFGGEEFELVFLRCYQNDSSPWETHEHRELEKMFYAIEDYDAAPVSEGEEPLDASVGADALRGTAAEVLASLTAGD